MIIAYGSGRNGKSTFFNTIARVMGSYSTTINAQILVEQDPSKNRFATSGLRGKRYALAAELADSTILNDAVIKQMTSTDMIHAEKKYKDEFEFKPSHTLVLYTNYLPKVKSTDTGIWRRLVVVPFNAVIPESDTKLDFAQQLFDNAAPAILKWMIIGAGRVIGAGGRIARPECVRRAIDTYQAANDWMNEFISECCVRGENLTVKKKALYDVYKSYAK